MLGNMVTEGVCVGTFDGAKLGTCVDTDGVAVGADVGLLVVAVGC